MTDERERQRERENGGALEAHPEFLQIIAR
jgi:hypothetical protein